MEDELLYQYLKDTGWDEAHLLNESFGADDFSFLRSITPDGISDEQIREYLDSKEEK